MRGDENTSGRYEIEDRNVWGDTSQGMVELLGGCLWSYSTRPEDPRAYSALHCPEYGVKVRSALHSQGSGAGRSNRAGEAYDRWNIPEGKDHTR